MPAQRQKPAKKHGIFGWIVKIIVIVLLLLVFGRALSFYGFESLDIIHYLRPTLTDEQIDKLINPIEPKGYQYPAPSAEALNRTVNCDDITYMFEFPRKSPLCLNMFQTSAEEITNKIATGSYDRIVLYGGLTVFDAPTADGTEEKYLTNLYNTVRFMDIIALPQFLKAYGLSDLSYIKITKPYPYIYYRISSLDEADKLCNQTGDKEKVSGCARSYDTSVIPIRAVGPQMSNAKPILRKTDNKRFSYLTHYPSDCYTNDVFAHETAHLLNAAGQASSGKRVMDSWLNEQVAGYFSIYGDDLACGDGTVTMQKNPDGSDVPKALAEFNSVSAPASLSHDYPEDNTCRQAILTEWYKFLTKGNYRDNFKQFFITQRSSFPTIVSDSDLIKLLLELDPSSKDFLVSKGCSL